MKTDPAIAAIRETRCKISRRYKHNTKALVDHYIALEGKYKERMIRKACKSPKDHA